MNRIAFPGTGPMGAQMVRQLLAGHPVTVWNRYPEKSRDLAPDGSSRSRLKNLDAAANLEAGAVLTLAVTETVRASSRDFVAPGHGDPNHSGLLLHLEAMDATRPEARTTDDHI
jgi:3-hydroxyisobutyrate dehydrogenase-like beta-hydroxyacid dehydrogenase